jgi:hypothetical protein
MRARRYIAPLLRLTALFGVLGAILLYLDYRSARASVVERLLGIGKRMAPYLDDARGTEGPRELHLNGLTLYVAAGHSAHPPALVRRWYADRYAGKGSAMELITDELKRQKVLPPTATGLTQASFGDDAQGGIAALDVGSVGSLRELAARLTHLGDGAVGRVGALRYLYYERTGDGGTRFLTVWSDERFDFAQLLPAPGGDTPGRDVVGVPRYPGTLRVLSSDERGTAGQLAVYMGGGAPELAEAFYVARMQTLGWSLDPRFAEVARAEGRRAQRFVSRDGHEVVIDESHAGDDQGVTITVVQLH